MASSCRLANGDEWLGDLCTPFAQRSPSLGSRGEEDAGVTTARSGQVSQAPPRRRDRPLVLHVLEAVEGGTARHLVDITRLVDSVRHEVVVPAERVGGVTDPEAVGAMEAAGGRVHLVAMTRNPLSLRNVRATAAVRR